MVFVVLAALAVSPQALPPKPPPIPPQKALPPKLPPAPPQKALPTIQPAPLGYLTAGELADRCADSAPSSASYCFAYIAGVHDVVRAYEIWLNQREFCAPVGTPQADLRRAFLTYVSAYPSNRGGQAASVIVVSLKETYPCAGAN